jgi:hypothetical protein
MHQCQIASVSDSAAIRRLNNVTESLIRYRFIIVVKIS